MIIWLSNKLLHYYSHPTLCLMQRVYIIHLLNIAVYMQCEIDIAYIQTKQLLSGMHLRVDGLSNC